MSMSSLSRVTRRCFLKHTGLAVLAAGSAPVISAPFVSRALADTKTLTMVQWSHFIPAYDKWFDQFAKDWGTKNNIEVTVDHIPVQNVASRAAAEASAGSGHDMFQWNGAGGPHLYRKFLVDVTSLVEDVEKKHGKISVIGRQIGYNQDDKTLYRSVSIRPGWRGGATQRPDAPRGNSEPRCRRAGRRHVTTDCARQSPQVI
jgi:multiple sugar transport system substrate-binding protein